MATISHGDMVLSIRHVDYRLPEELIGYELLVTIGGRPMVNPDAILWTPKPTGHRVWDRLAPGALLVEGDAPCEFLELFDKALATDRGQFRSFPADEVEFALYPDFVLPVQPMVGQRDWDTWRRRMEEHVGRTPGPDDCWELHLQIGWVQFTHREPGGAILFHMLVRRKEMQAFADQLRTEYLPFAQAHSLPV